MGKQSFIVGTLILLSAGIFNRILGFIPRIMLPRLIGAEGVGLYQLGWPFLSVILTIVVGGIPLAVAKMVARAEAEGNERQIRTILKISLTLAALLSLFFTGLCLAASSWITKYLLTDSRVYYTFLSMSPIIPIVAVSAVLRGYFQGRQNMIPPALSQIIETILRIIMVLVFAYALLPYGIPFAAAGAMLGVLAGEIAGFVMLFIYYQAAKPAALPSTKESTGESRKVGRIRLLRDFIKITIPVTGSRLIGSSSYLLEAILIAQGLAAAGIITSIATAQYGALQGMVIPILLLPGALTSALSTSLIPSLSEAAARNDLKTVHTRLHQSIRLALIAGAPFSVIMFVLAEPLCELLYNQPQVGSMLAMMAPIGLFLYIQAPLQASLQALDRPGTALMNTLLGALVKLMLIWILVRQPEIGIKGAIMASNANIILVTSLHLISVKRWLKFSVSAKDLLKIIVAMIVSGMCSYFVMQIPWNDRETLRFLAACVISVFTYIGMMIGLGLIHHTDFIRLIKFGRNIVKA